MNKVLTNVAGGYIGQARQGDVFLSPITEGQAYALTNKAKRKPDLILAMGEGTGHNHVIEGVGAEIFTTWNNTIVRVPNGGWLVHTSDPAEPDHERIQLAPGSYLFTRQSDMIGAVRQSYVRD